MTDDPLVNTEGLADWLAVSNSAVQDATLRRGADEGCPRSLGTQASVRAYCTHLCKLALERGTDTPAEAKGRLARAQAELAEMKARRLSGELVPLETVRTQSKFGLWAALA